MRLYEFSFVKVMVPFLAMSLPSRKLEREAKSSISSSEINWVIGVMQVVYQNFGISNFNV